MNPKSPTEGAGARMVRAMNPSEVAIIASMTAGP